MSEKLKVKKWKLKVNNENIFMYMLFCWKMFIYTWLVLELRLWYVQ